MAKGNKWARYAAALGRVAGPLEKAAVGAIGRSIAGYLIGDLTPADLGRVVGEAVQGAASKSRQPQPIMDKRSRRGRKEAESA